MGIGRASKWEQIHRSKINLQNKAKQGWQHRQVQGATCYEWVSTRIRS